MKYYIASPLFTVAQKERIKKVARALRWYNEVYSPMEHQIPDAWELPNDEWAQKVFKNDLDALKDADAVVVIYDGLYSDSGTAWEVGCAYAMNKTIIVIVANEKEMQSLMVFGSASRLYTFDNFIKSAENNSPLYQSQSYPHEFIQS